MPQSFELPELVSRDREGQTGKRCKHRGQQHVQPDVQWCKHRVHHDPAGWPINQLIALIGELIALPVNWYTFWQFVTIVGLLSDHFYCKFMAEISLKSPGNCSGPCWSHNFSICSWENPITLISISIISGLWDVSLSPKTNMFYPGRPQNTLKHPRKFPHHFRKPHLDIFHNVGD